MSRPYSIGGRPTKRARTDIGDDIKMEKSQFDTDDGCDVNVNEKKRRGACGQTSMEDCGLCPDFNARNFIYRNSRTKSGHNIKLMHQCRAICESTGVRCTRHVWQDDAPGWNNQYQQPLWCKQHAEKCDGGQGRLGHMGWYKRICADGGLKQPKLKFMDDWIMLPNNKRNHYQFLRTANPQLLAELIEEEFWYKVYREPRNDPPSSKDIRRAYQDSNYLNLMTEYFVYLTECANRRLRNNDVCFTGEYDLFHDDYLKAVLNMINAMRQSMPLVYNNLEGMKTWLISNSADQFAVSLRLNEPIEHVVEFSHKINFKSNEWSHRVQIQCKTYKDWKKLNDVAPSLYALLLPNIEYLDDIDVDMNMPKSDIPTIVPVAERSTYLHGNMLNFEHAIQQLLSSTGHIPANVITERNVLGILLFMDFWNIAVVPEDAEIIIKYLVHNKDMPETVSFLSLSQSYGSDGFFIRKHMAVIIESILRVLLTKIIEDYQKRLDNPKAGDVKKKLEENIRGFNNRVDTIVKYVRNLKKPIPSKIFEIMLNINTKGGQHQTPLMWNKVVISDLNNFIIKPE